MHIAPQYAPQLRNFIETRDAEEFAHARDTRIVVIGPGGSRIGFRILAHGAELMAIKRRSPAAHPLLMIENVSPGPPASRLER